MTSIEKNRRILGIVRIIIKMKRFLTLLLIGLIKKLSRRGSSTPKNIMEKTAMVIQNLRD